MYSKFRATVDIYKGLKSFCMGRFAWKDFKWTASLIPSSRQETQWPVYEEFNQRIEHVEEHRLNYENTHIVKPECIYTGIKASK